MDEMEWSKIVGGVCGALLFYLVLNTLADAIYHVGDDGHGHGAKTAALPASVYALEQDSSATPAKDGVAGDAQPDIQTLLASADIDRGAKVFAKCKACHKLADGKNGVGPHLYKIIDRAIGGVDGYAYSGAMANFGGVWDIDTLNAFLIKPKDLIAGTKMSFAGLKKAQDRANIIAYLQSLQ